MKCIPHMIPECPECKASISARWACNVSGEGIAYLKAENAKLRVRLDAATEALRFVEANPGCMPPTWVMSIARAEIAQATKP